MPEFADEAADVMTTKLTKPAAAASPARANILTNGDSPALNSVHGRTDMRMTSAPT